MVPVPKEDFRKINDLAEASWIAKDPSNVQTIRELRRNLLKEVEFSLASSEIQTNISAQPGSDRGAPGEKQSEGGAEMISPVYLCICILYSLSPVQ